MNKISCDLCMDLIPLVKDGVASQDSKQAVDAHIASCEACRAFYNGETPPPVDTVKTFEKFHRRLQLSSAMLMMFGIFFGLSLTAGNDMFYNTLIMPVIGALGYYIFRWKALYIVPALMLITHLATNLFGFLRGIEHLDLYSILIWTFLYSIFAILGTIIAWLLHFAFRKER